MLRLAGAKLIEEIKQTQLDIKVILMTGLIEEEVAVQIKQQIIDDFIIKPIDYNELGDEIDRLF